MPPQVIVLERETYWAASLAWELLSTSIDVCQVEQVRWLTDRLSADPIISDDSTAAGSGGAMHSAYSTVIVWETSTDLGEMLNWLGRQLPHRTIPVIACADPQLAELEWTLRGCGVVSWSTEFRPPHELAQLCRRLLEPQTAPSLEPASLPR